MTKPKSRAAQELGRLGGLATAKKGQPKENYVKAGQARQAQIRAQKAKQQTKQKEE